MKKANETTSKIKLLKYDDFKLDSPKKGCLPSVIKQTRI